MADFNREEMHVRGSELVDAVGGALVLFAPVLAAIGAMAALVKNVKIEVERTDE